MGSGTLLLTARSLKKADPYLKWGNTAPSLGCPLFPKVELTGIGFSKTVEIGLHPLWVSAVPKRSLLGPGG